MALRPVAPTTRTSSTPARATSDCPAGSGTRTPSTTTPGEPPVELGAALRRFEPDLLACYRRGLEQNPRLRGALVVGFALDGAGKVSSPRSEINSLGDEGVVRCVMERVRTARLPRPSRAGQRVSLPIYFSSADD